MNCIDIRSTVSHCSLRVHPCIKELGLNTLKEVKKKQKLNLTVFCACAENRKLTSEFVLRFVVMNDCANFGDDRLKIVGRGRTHTHAHVWTFLQLNLIGT